MANNKMNLPPRAPYWPWGGPRALRERLVDPAEFAKKKAAGDPKNPALPSAALLDSIANGHTADELRLPWPPLPDGHDADLTAFTDRQYLEAVADRGQKDDPRSLDRALSKVATSPERADRLRALLGREQQMLSLVGQLHADLQEIQRKIREEQRDSGF